MSLQNIFLNYFIVYDFYNSIFIVIVNNIYEIFLTVLNFRFTHTIFIFEISQLI